jgi:hypothetical protein
MTIKTTTRPATTSTPTGLAPAELEAELVSELPEREEMSSAFRFVLNHPYVGQNQRYIRVWDARHHRFIFERVTLYSTVRVIR